MNGSAGDLLSNSPPAALPLPRPSLRVGITGHRLDKLPEAELSDLRERLRELLSGLDTALLRFSRRAGGVIYSGEAPQGRLVTALAEGSDRLAVDAAPAHWSVSALLPMPRELYRDDFLPEGATTSPSTEAFSAYLEAADTVTELAMVQPPTGGDPPKRHVQYAALGRALVRQVDCLVAVWDGKPPKGPGGTAAVIAEAKDLGLAILWLDPADRAPASQIMRFRGGDIARPELGPADESALDRMVEQLLGFEASGERPPAALTEPWPNPRSWAGAYPTLMRIAGAGRPVGRTHAERRWPPPDPLLSALGESLPASRDAVADLRRVVAPRSYWADMLAWSHANLYRSAYVTAFLLAGLAVPIGLLATFADKGSHALGVKAVAVAVELAIVLFVAWLVLRGRRGRWHANWIEARELSELLRVSRPLLLFGRADDLFENTPLRERPKESFPVWYAKATLREMRPVSGLLDGTYLGHVLAATRTRLVAGQIAYHRANIAKLSRIDRLLHHWGDRCFVATIAVLALYLALFAASLVLPGALEGPLTYVAKPLVSVLAASLPAMGAALAGIRAQGEFANRVQQSERSLAALTSIAAEIDEVLSEPAGRIPPEHAGDLVVATARVMMEDVSHWRHVYVGKTLALPS